MALRKYSEVGNKFGANPVDVFPEAASQTFKAGDPVILSSGKVAIAGSSGANLGAGVKLLGFACQDATGITNSLIKVDLCVSGTFIDLPMVTTGSDTALAPALTDIGVAYELRMTAAGYLAVSSSTTNTKVVVQQISITDNPKWPTAFVAGGRVRVEVLAAQRALGAV